MPDKPTCCPTVMAVCSSPQLLPISPDHSADPWLGVPAQALRDKRKNSLSPSSSILSEKPRLHSYVHAGSTSVSRPLASFHCPPLMYTVWSGSAWSIHMARMPYLP